MASCSAVAATGASEGIREGAGVIYAHAIKKSYQLRTRHKKVSQHLHAMHPKFIDTHAILDGFC
jgi:hypothetical protein